MTLNTLLQQIKNMLSVVLVIVNFTTLDRNIIEKFQHKIICSVNNLTVDTYDAVFLISRWGNSGIIPITKWFYELQGISLPEISIFRLNKTRGLATLEIPKRVRDDNCGTASCLVDRHSIHHSSHSSRY